MIYQWLARLLAVLLTLRIGPHRSGQDKAVEILLLRYQLHMLEQRLDHKPHPSRWEKLVLAVLVAQLKHLRRGMDRSWEQSIRLFTPATILRWPRELVRRTWTFSQRR